MGREAGGGGLDGAAAAGEYRRAKLSVWWDIENCQVPKGCDTLAIAQNISSALVKLDYCGPVSISAYGDTNRIPPSVQQALSSTGISLNHVPAGVKDASDKKILVDMLFWAVDNPAPANYLLISGDRDFANALHQLRMRRYNILLAQPFQASPALVAAAKTVWLWTSLLEGGPPLDSTTPLAIVDSSNNLNILRNQVSYNNHPTNTQDKCNSHAPAKTDPKYKGKYVRKTPNQQQPTNMPSAESKMVDYSSSELAYAQPTIIRKAPHEFFGSNNPIAFAGGSPSSTAYATHPSPVDRRDYVTNQQHVHNNNIHSQPFLQKAPTMPLPLGVTDSKSPHYSCHSQFVQLTATNEFFAANIPTASAGWSLSNTSSDPSAKIRSDFTANHQTQCSYHSRPSTVPLHSNSAPANLYPPNMHTHAFHPLSRPDAPPSFSSPFTDNLCISERLAFVPSSVNTQQPARPEVKMNSHKHSTSTSPNVSQKGPNIHTSYNYSSFNERSSEPRCNMTSLLTVSVPSTASVQHGVVTIPPPSEYEQGLAGVILLALDNLRNEMITPTEANITDCIRFGDLKHRNTDVRKALDCAVKQNMVVKQILGQVQMYVIKNQKLGNCVNPMGGKPSEYPKATWDRIQEFLISFDGRSALAATTCRYEAGLVLKNSCLQDLALGKVLQILNMLITVKRWMKHQLSGWKPVTVTLVEGGDTQTSNSADSDA